MPIHIIGRHAGVCARLSLSEGTQILDLAFMLDTGSDLTLISEETATRLGVDVSNLEVRQIRSAKRQVKVRIIENVLLAFRSADLDVVVELDIIGVLDSTQPDQEQNQVSFEILGSDVLSHTRVEISPNQQAGVLYLPTATLENGRRWVELKQVGARLGIPRRALLHMSSDWGLTQEFIDAERSGYLPAMGRILTELGLDPSSFPLGEGALARRRLKDDSLHG